MTGTGAMCLPVVGPPGDYKYRLTWEHLWGGYLVIRMWAMGHMMHVASHDSATHLSMLHTMSGSDKPFSFAFDRSPIAFLRQFSTSSLSETLHYTPLQVVRFAKQADREFVNGHMQFKIVHNIGHAQTVQSMRGEIHFIFIVGIRFRMLSTLTNVF